MPESFVIPYVKAYFASKWYEFVILQAKEEEKKKKEEEEKKRKEEEEKQKEAAAKERIPEEPPLEKEVLDGFVDSMLPGCLKLLDDIPDTVYR